MTTFLETAEDLEWLRDVHKITVPRDGVAILFGNEDAPNKVVAYSQNNINAEHDVYEPNEAGVLTLQPGKKEPAI